MEVKKPTPSGTTNNNSASITEEKRGI